VPVTRTGSAFEILVACLRGEPPSAADWPAVLRIANRTLLTPALFDALACASRLDALPGECRAYLEFLHDRNEERNRRLRAQLLEAVGQLNSAGIEPLLLKGAVRLFCDPDSPAGSRMTRDLDIAVGARQLKAARECLVRLGYRDLIGGRGMERPQDAGVLELRQHPGPSSAVRLPRQHDTRSLVLRAGVHARIPSPTQRALHWILHDLVKEGDYWRGRIDLRHLHDLAELARADAKPDWACLREVMPDRTGRNAIDTQLWALHVLFGVEIPMAVQHRRIVRMQHWRRMVSARHPVAAAPLRFAGNLAWAMKRMRAPGNLSDRGTVDFARRAQRTLFGYSGSTKL
jgi:hypothetical protein